LKIFNKYKDGNIQIICAPRTCGTYLSTIIFASNNTPNILFNEPFNSYKNNIYSLSDMNILSDMCKISKVSFQKNIISFSDIQHLETKNKIIKHHIHKNNIKTINFCSSLNNWFTIILFRKNFFETILSICIAILTNQWHSSISPLVTIPFDLFRDQMLWYLKKYKLFYEKIILENIDIIIYSEDLTFTIENDLQELDFSENYTNTYNKMQIQKSMNKKIVALNYDKIKEYYFKLIKYINIPGITIDGEIIHLDKFKEYE